MEYDNMPFLATCPRCKQKLKIGDNAVGKQIKCSGCGNVFAARTTVPAPSEEEKPAFKVCTCPSCHSDLKLAASVPDGKRIKCPRCATVFPVMREEAPRAAPEEAIADQADPDEDEAPEERAPCRRRRTGKNKPRKASLALRVSALILGLIGGLFSGGLGAAWLKQASSPEVKTMRDFVASVADETKSRELNRAPGSVRPHYPVILLLAAGRAARARRRRVGSAGPREAGRRFDAGRRAGALILNVVTLMSLYFLLVGGLLALLTPSWPPGSGPRPVVLALLAVGGWVAILIGWLVMILLLPKAAPELKTEGRPSPVVPPAQRGGPDGRVPMQPPRPLSPQPGQNPSPQKNDYRTRIEELWRQGNYEEVQKLARQAMAENPGTDRELGYRDKLVLALDMLNRRDEATAILQAAYDEEKAKGKSARLARALTDLYDQHVQYEILKRLGWERAVMSVEDAAKARQLFDLILRSAREDPRPEWEKWAANKGINSVVSSYTRDAQGQPQQWLTPEQRVEHIRRLLAAFPKNPRLAFFGNANLAPLLERENKPKEALASHEQLVQHWEKTPIWDRFPCQSDRQYAENSSNLERVAERAKAARLSQRSNGGNSGASRWAIQESAPGLRLRQPAERPGQPIPGA